MSAPQTNQPIIGDSTAPSSIGKFVVTSTPTKKATNKWLKYAIDSVGIYVTLIVILILALSTIAVGVKISAIILLVLVVIVQILQLYKIDVTRFL